MSAESRRFLGLSLGGAKSDRTCLTVLDFYQKQNKAFILDVFESIGPEKGGPNADQALLELVSEHQPGVEVLATDAPLTLPPCLLDCDSSCGGYDKCKNPTVRWMRNQYSRAAAKHPKLKHFTPYTQRPVDLYFRYKHVDEEIFQDETMGANLAPQASRMQYLKRRLEGVRLIEVWPKLALYYLQKPLRLSRRDVWAYRHVERGLHVRERILEKLAEKAQVFIYERDLKKFIHNIGSFDSLLCAWVALQFHLERVVRFRGELPLESGWVQIPEL